MMFAIGESLRRTEIHRRFGGQQQGGMCTPKSIPAIFLFTGEKGERYGYRDHFQPDGVFWYTGEGQIGHMKFVRANKALRDHAKNAKRVFLFEETARSHVAFISEVVYLAHHLEERPDLAGNPRQAIVFHLGLVRSLEGAPEPGVVEKILGAGPQLSTKPLKGLPLEELRRLALLGSAPQSSRTTKTTVVHVRSDAVREYALKRANGICESCRQAAPFVSRKLKRPFLEVHHVYRVADGGPDHPASVAAICPNCHREVHSGLKGMELNAQLISFLVEREGTPDLLQLVLPDHSELTPG